MNALKRTQRGFTLVGTLVVVAIIAIMMVTFYASPWSKTSGSGPDENGSTKKTVVGNSMDRSRDAECANNLRQVRQSIQMYSADGNNPPSLNALPGLPTSFLACPSGGGNYLYDPKTGEVKCPVKRHQRF